MCMQPAHTDIVDVDVAVLGSSNVEALLVVEEDDVDTTGVVGIGVGLFFLCGVMEREGTCDFFW